MSNNQHVVVKSMLGISLLAQDHMYASSAKEANTKQNPPSRSCIVQLQHFLACI